LENKEDLRKSVLCLMEYTICKFDTSMDNIRAAMQAISYAKEELTDKV
jgi:hypothetical protein